MDITGSERRITPSDGDTSGRPRMPLTTVLSSAARTEFPSLRSLSDAGTPPSSTAEAVRPAGDLAGEVLAAITEQAVIVTNADGMIRLFNPGAERLLGHPAGEVVGRRSIVSLHDPAELQSRSPEATCPAFDVLVASARSGRGETREWTYRASDGSIRPVSVSVTPLGSAAEDAGYVFVASDSTERHRTEAALRTLAGNYAHRAMHDELTGLPNRALLRDRLEHAITVAARNGRCIGLLFIDLDRFKEVNDKYGHVAGDELLIHVAARITAAARDSDTVVRFGGDEFVVVCEDLKDPGELVAVVRRIQESVEQRILLADHWILPRASIGSIVVPGSEATAKDLIAQADEAMYRSRGMR